ncbi:DUF6049 family protein [Actinokineospora sp.]|uniref:DUF6049 family protein n=1 Tax=Actinokineospora sp. TaxID=1872133 RepID=UPI0040381BE2
MISRLRRAGFTALAAGLVLLGAPAAAQQPSSRMRVELDRVSPRVVDASAQTVTVSGKITNTGDRKVERLEVRLQRGDVLDTEPKLRQALAEPQETSAASRPTASSAFQDITGVLEPGQTADFALTVPLGGERGALRVDKPGVYPIAVNINGVPDFGRTERVGALSLLLPVLSVSGGGAVPPPADPSRLGLLWPLVDDQPRRIETRPDGGPTIFSDDGLTASLGTGGRLFTLVSAVQSAAAADPTLLRSLCFAIDPDLIGTVQAMISGYQVRTGSGVVDGRGSGTAELWLSRVRELTRGQCVVALPFADADLVALSRSDTVDLQTLAMSASSQVEEVLGVKPLPGVVWPAGGTLDQRTLADLSSARRTTVLADATRLQRTTGAAPYTLGGNALRAIPYDELVASSLAPRAEVGLAGFKTAPAQNGLATLVFRGAFQAAPGQPVLVAPPRRWSASMDELTMFLRTVQQLTAQGYVRPLSLPSLVEGADQGTASGLDYNAQDSGAEIPAPVTAEVARINAVQRELIKNVFTEDDTVQVDPAVLVAPLQLGLIRATSTGWRDRPEAAADAARAVSDQLAALLSQVTVNDPGRPLTLASSDSPIPVYITNALPVSVLARINLGDTPGLRPEETIFVKIPARLGINRYLPTKVTRAGRFTVDVYLTTENGTALGGTSRVELNSTSYGSITIVVTGTAAGALVLLVGLRLFRRVRAARTANAAAEGSGLQDL